MIPRRKPSSSASPKVDPRPPVMDLILDSGAYSAWRLGKPINIDGYCDYLLANLDWIGHYVNLDVINPGSPEEAARASFENLKHMRKRGLDPVPVYHVGEDISWLFRMLDLGCKYIGLSASSLVSRNKVDDWYAMAWSHLVDSDGRPTVRAHAFGEGRYTSLRQFPWYSADSTSWIYGSQRNGNMVFEDGRKAVHRNDGLHHQAAQDIEHMDEVERAEFEAILAKHGISAAAFQERGSFESTALRTYLTMLYYERMQSRIRALQPIAFRPQGLFAPEPRDGVPPIEEVPFKFHLVIGGNPTAQAVLAHAGYENVLVSYFYIMQTKHYGQLPRFVRDPKGIAAAEAPYAKPYAVLEKFINAPVPA